MSNIDQEMTMNAHFENTPRTIALALGIWALGVAAGALTGVFAKFPVEEWAALAAFGIAFAVATAWLDRNVREAILATSTGTLANLAVEADLAIALAMALALGLPEGALAPALRDFLAAMAMLFAAPVAVVLHLALAERLLELFPARRNATVAAAKPRRGKLAAY